MTSIDSLMEFLAAVAAGTNCSCDLLRLDTSRFDDIPVLADICFEDFREFLRRVCASFVTACNQGLAQPGLLDGFGGFGVKRVHDSRGHSCGAKQTMPARIVHESGNTRLRNRWHIWQRRQARGSAEAERAQLP